MEQMTWFKLIKMTSGYYYKIDILIICSIIYVIIFLDCSQKSFEVLIVILTIIEILMFFSLYKESCKAKNLLRNGKIIHTKILKAEQTYYGIKYIFKLRSGDVYIQSSYFDEKTGIQFLFETYCSGKKFSGKKRYWEEGIRKVEVYDIDVLVNQTDYSQYIMLVE